MSISFQSEDEAIQKLRDKLRKMTDEELIRFGKEVRRLAENPFQRQLDEARREWKRRKAHVKRQKLSRRASEERGCKFFQILRRVCWPLGRGSYSR
jgi:U3 small nucleolar ribonucleoprotein component